LLEQSGAEDAAPFIHSSRGAAPTEPAVELVIAHQHIRRAM
jgi:hypothetical protein